MARLNVFNFKDHKEYLRLAVKDRLQAQTLDQCAARLGYRSPRSVAMVLNGQRLPSGEMLERFAEVLSLSSRERRYLELLVRLDNLQRRNLETDRVVQELQALNPRQDFHVFLNKQTFAPVSEWYYLVIRQMADGPGFVEDTAQIRRRLRNKVSESQIRSAIDTMLSLGLLARDPETGKLTVDGASVRTQADVPSSAVRQHHRQMCGRALDTLMEQAVENREFCTATFRVDRRRMAAAKEALRQFRDHFIAEFRAEDGSDVGQLNLHFFFHTEPV